MARKTQTGVKSKLNISYPAPIRGKGIRASIAASLSPFRRGLDRDAEELLPKRNDVADHADDAFSSPPRGLNGTTNRRPASSIYLASNGRPATTVLGSSDLCANLQRDSLSPMPQRQDIARGLSPTTSATAGPTTSRVVEDHRGTGRVRIVIDSHGGPFPAVSSREDEGKSRFSVASVVQTTSRRISRAMPKPLRYSTIGPLKSKEHSAQRSRSHAKRVFRKTCPIFSLFPIPSDEII